jgi:hypothetical protein
MKAHYYRDPQTDLPYIYRHDVSELEVEEALERSAEDQLGGEGCRVAIGYPSTGRTLRVIYASGPKPTSLFVITAYDLRGKPLFAYRRRERRKRS